MHMMSSLSVAMVTGEYQRLDVLQGDVVAILKQACREGKGEVAKETGLKFLAARDWVCGEGRGHLWSAALTYTAR